MACQGLFMQTVSLRVVTGVMMPWTSGVTWMPQEGQKPQTGWGALCSEFHVTLVQSTLFSGPQGLLFTRERRGMPCLLWHGCPGWLCLGPSLALSENSGMTLLPHPVSYRGRLSGQGSRGALRGSDSKRGIPASSGCQDVPGGHLHSLPPRGQLGRLSQDTLWLFGRLPPSLGPPQRQSGPTGLR